MCLLNNNNNNNSWHSILYYLTILNCNVFLSPVCKQFKKQQKITIFFLFNNLPVITLVRFNFWTVAPLYHLSLSPYPSFSFSLVTFLFSIYLVWSWVRFIWLSLDCCYYCCWWWWWWWRCCCNHNINVGYKGNDHLCFHWS